MYIPGFTCLVVILVLKTLVKLRIWVFGSSMFEIHFHWYKRTPKCVWFKHASFWQVWNTLNLKRKDSKMCLVLRGFGLGRFPNNLHNERKLNCFSNDVKLVWEYGMNGFLLTGIMYFAPWTSWKLIKRQNDKAFIEFTSN